MIHESKHMNKKKVFAIVIAFILMILTCCTISNGATVSTDIDGIDESKYPGYKERIKELKKIYPNISVLYTGLDWNTVIKNERYHSRNLVPKNYSEEWICPECGKKEYDTGWYCASEEAIKYLMDPRLYLNTNDIFQFQKLNTSAGTLNINNISLATQETFLNTSSIAQAIYDTAKNNNINAFHIITRTLLEQGGNGTSTLSSGNEYIGTNGVVYKGLYNLFSIGATGKDSAEVKTNGLQRALNEGWTSREASITGGGAFLKDKYINRNQNTIYLQKFDVDDSYDGICYHQYMQNLFAAKNEANLMYEAYSKTKLLLNKDFAFVIPLYENMPVELTQEPNPEYYGAINTDLKTIEMGTENDGRSYITGKILIAEWIDGVACVPKTTPEMTIKATDGTYSAGVNLIHNGGLEYSYYRILDTLDKDKEYYLEVRLTTEKNISTNKVQIASLPSKNLGDYKGLIVKCRNNKLYFSRGEYIGEINTDLKEIGLYKNDSGRYYLSGNMLVAEWINGVACIPKTVPELRLKSTDGIISRSMYISHLEGLNYYYDIFIDEIDVSKQYYIEATLTSEDNIGNVKNQKVILPTKELGSYNSRNIILEDNDIKFTYIGEINTDLKTINLAQNEIGRNYIYGDIIIVEWINGETYVPEGLPKMTIKATDGTYETGMHVVHNGGVSYTYDRVVDNLDISKEYEIEVELTGNNNIGKEKIQITQLPNKEVGEYEQVRIITEDNKIKMVDSSLYEGEINTDLKTMHIDVNEVGREYIHGNILIAEWIEGEARIPTEIPELTLKSTDGTYSAGMYVAHEGGLNYYYDRVIFDLDTNKEYYIEAKLTSRKNIGNNKEQKVNINAEPNVGEFKDKKLIIGENKIVFKGKEYEGEINTDLKTMYIDVNEVGREYIHGNVLIAEWIEGEARIPTEIPELTLKSTDGTYSAGMYVAHEGGLNYYYDRVIFDLDTSKEYYIEAKLTNKYNISTRKTQKVNLNAEPNVGEFKDKKLIIGENKIVFKGKEYEGEINTDLKTMYIDVNEVGREYIHGNVLIAEWIEGEARIPTEIPKLTLKSTDGTYSAGMYVAHEGGLNYYYDIFIDSIDVSKEYYIEAKLTNKYNISTRKTQKVNLNAEPNVGIFKESEMKLKENKIIFESIERTMKVEREKKIEGKNEKVEIKETEKIEEINEIEEDKKIDEDDKENENEKEEEKEEEIKQEETQEKVEKEVENKSPDEKIK